MPPVELVGALNENVDAIGADATYRERTGQAEKETCMVEGQGHGKDSRTQATFEQMDESIRVSETEKNKNISSLEDINTRFRGAWTELRFTHFVGYITDHGSLV